MIQTLVQNRQGGIEEMKEKAIALAKNWRDKKGYTGKGGVVVIFDNAITSWVNELRDPHHWEPGCVAVDESGNQWVTAGGNAQKGAERWEPIIG
jgi:hypothetical protein